MGPLVRRIMSTAVKTSNVAARNIPAICLDPFCLMRRICRMRNPHQCRTGMWLIFCYVTSYTSVFTSTSIFCYFFMRSSLF